MNGDNNGHSKRVTHKTRTFRECIPPVRHVIISKWDNPDLQYLLYIDGVTYIGHYISTLYITYIRHHISALFNLSFMFIHCHKR